ELRRLAAPEEDVDHVVAVEAPAPAEDGLLSVVVPHAPVGEITAVAIEAPAGESARRLLDVVLGVMPLPESEELHHLAREILVGRLPAAAGVVEVDEHRRVLRHGV